MGKIAFVFAGQGAQYTGMCKGLSPETLARLDAVRPGTARQIMEADADELMKTDVTQPCVYAADLMAAFALEERGIKADAVAGYSLGEIAALAYAGAFSIEEGMKLVAKRGEAMQKASDLHETGMAAILKLSDEKVIEICSRFDQVYPVNFNCKGQISCAGDKAQLLDFAQEVKAEGGLARILEVAGGFHSPFMKTAADELESVFASVEFEETKIPVYANYTAAPYEGNDADIMTKQIVNPILWQKAIENMIASGVDTFIEVGPGNRLGKMLSRISKDILLLNVENEETLEAAVKAVGGR